MAKLEDVVVSDRLWRWTSAPPGKNVSLSPRAQPFIIIKVGGDGNCGYRYIISGMTFRASASNIAAHAEPEPLPAPPKCEPGCEPGDPCWRTKICPAYNEPSADTMASDNRRYSQAEDIRRRLEAREPIELRCGRELACGLFRTP